MPNALHSVPLHAFVTNREVVAHPLPDFVAGICLGLLQLLRLYSNRAQLCYIRRLKRLKAYIKLKWYATLLSIWRNCTT